MESSWVSVWTTAPSNYYQLGSDARFRVGRHQTKRRPEPSLGENCSDSSLGIISGLKPTCSQDLICCSENFLCAPFRDRVRIVTDAFVQPVLNVASRVIRSFQTKCFTA